MSGRNSPVRNTIIALTQFYGHKMKKVIYTIICGLLMIACDVNDNPYGVLDKYAGTYVLENATWEGASLDLNGDNLVSGSLLDEISALNGYTLRQNSFKLVIAGHSGLDRGYACAYLPIQAGSDKSSVINGEKCWNLNLEHASFPFTYIIRNGSEMTFEHESTVHYETSSSSYRLLSSYTDIAIEFGDNTVTLRLKATFFNANTEGYSEGNVMFVYRK